MSAEGFTTGNGVIGIRLEDKNVWESRTPITPENVRFLLAHGAKKIIVQPSRIRCYSNEEYEEAGAEISEDLSPAGTIVAMKEVPVKLLLPNRTYMFFSHTVKAQSYNMPLLDAMLEKKIRCFDYERIQAPDRTRIVNSGLYAGYCGMLDTLNGVGLAYLNRGFRTPFLSIGLSRHYLGFHEACEAVNKVGEIIRTQGLPSEICPIMISVTGSGCVSTGAQQILHHLPCRYISVEDVPRYSSHKFENKVIFIVISRVKDLVEPKDPAHKFDEQEYFDHPDRYIPTFHERVMPYIHVLVNGIFWDERYPRLITTDQARALQKEGRFPLMVLGDISADPNGSVEFLEKTCSIQNPFYFYDIEEHKSKSIEEYNGKGVLIMGVDHLPAELGRDASSDFGDALSPMLAKVCQNKGTDSLEKQKQDLGDILYNSMITNGGKLTPAYEYITELRKKTGV